MRRAKAHGMGTVLFRRAEAPEIRGNREKMKPHKCKNELINKLAAS